MISILTCTRFYAKHLKGGVTDSMNGAVNSRYNRLLKVTMPWLFAFPTSPQRKDVPFQGRGVQVPEMVQ